MATLEFVNTAIMRFPQFRAAHPIAFIICLVIYFLFSVLVVLGAWKMVKSLRLIWHKILRVFLALLSCLFFLPISFVFFIAGEVVEAIPSISSTGFYIEIIIITSLVTALKIFFFNRYLNKFSDKSDTDDGLEYMKEIIKGAIIVLMSLACIFTDIEIYIQNWGFSLFGKKIGQWTYNAYLAWTAAVLMMFVQSIIQLPFMALFGNPMNYFEKNFDI